MKKKKNKEVYLCGGFGNIMFQFVLINRLIDLGYDVVIYDNFLKDNFITKHLLRWKLQNDFYKIYFEKNNITINHSSHFKFLIDLFMLSLSKFKKKAFFKYIFNPTSSDLNHSSLNNKVFMGYFQNKAFLENSQFAIKTTVNGIRKFIVHIPEENVVHFRGGDSGHSNNNVKMMEKILTRIENIKIVTDDISKLKKVLLNKNLDVVSNSPLIDFSILCSAQKTLVCSNSTFSWWAANVVKKEVKIIMPSKLYNTIGFSKANKLKLIE